MLELTWTYGERDPAIAQSDTREFPDLDALRVHLVECGLTTLERLTLLGQKRVTVHAPGFAPERYTLTEVRP